MLLGLRRSLTMSRRGCQVERYAYVRLNARLSVWLGGHVASKLGQGISALRARNVQRRCSVLRPKYGESVSI